MKISNPSLAFRGSADFLGLSLKTWAQFENLGELVKNTIFVA